MGNLQEEGIQDRERLVELQQARFTGLVQRILPTNRFYSQKFAEAGLQKEDLTPQCDISRLPFTTKQELLEDQQQHPPYGTNLCQPLTDYSRYHQTSGTRGHPLRWLDTSESWQWVLDCWKKIFQHTAITQEDRLLFAFSFGPFLGFWSAFEAAGQIGCLCLPGGGLSSLARIRYLRDNAATIVLCTPTYALHLAEVAREYEIDLGKSAVRALIVAGEPGGSIPSTRARIEEGWGARLFDHSGMTEIGPLSFECIEAPGGLHILEEDYLVEIVDIERGTAVEPGTPGELVVTNLGRFASPLIRYRTGDIVRAQANPCRCGLPWIRLEGGILGRVDELIHVRGNNVYPSALEEIIRSFPQIVEFRIEVDQSGPLSNLCIEIETDSPETGSQLAEKASRAIRDQLLFRAEVRSVPQGTLPRFEMKARRFVRKK